MNCPPKMTYKLMIDLRVKMKSLMKLITMMIKNLMMMTPTL